MTGRALLAGARAIEGVLGRMPEGAARGVGALLGEVARRPLGVRRGVVVRQVAAAFPDRDAAWVERTVRACYRHFGRELAALPGLRRAGAAGLRERTTGLAEAGSLLREHGVPGRGALVVTGHVGNWELAGAALAALGLPVSAAYRPPDPPFDAWVADLRRGMGIEPVPEARAPFRLLRALRRNRVVALVADQHAGSRGAVVSFLGREASTWQGPARLALRAAVPLFFGALLRDGEGYRARLEAVPVRDAGGDVELTRRWVARLEAAVERWPAQYFWFHRRWKAAERGEARAAVARKAGTSPGSVGRSRR